jgi:hypothetical protein
MAGMPPPAGRGRLLATGARGGRRDAQIIVLARRARPARPAPARGCSSWCDAAGDVPVAPVAAGAGAGARRTNVRNLRSQGGARRCGGRVRVRCAFWLLQRPHRAHTGRQCPLCGAPARRRRSFSAGAACSELSRSARAGRVPSSCLAHPQAAQPRCSCTLHAASRDDHLVILWAPLIRAWPCPGPAWPAPKQAAAAWPAATCAQSPPEPIYQTCIMAFFSCYWYKLPLDRAAG